MTDKFIYLRNYTKAGTEFLGVDYPIICGAMTWVSEHNLVSIVSNTGGFGVLAGGNMPPDIFEKEIELTRNATKKPFGVNLITIAPNYHEHLEIAVQKKVSHVIFAGSFPRSTEIAKAKDAGIKTICFASTQSIAERMIRFGTDALILEGSEAGGHIGHVSSLVLIQQVLFQIKGIPIFVAGGIGTGKMMAHLLLMGAAGIQMGTRFVLSTECKAHPNFKDAFIRAEARDAVSTPQFDSALPIVSVRALKNEGTRKFGKLQLELLERLKKGELSRKEAQYKVEEYWAGALKRAVIDGDIQDGSLMAGQSVGLVDKIKPIKEIIDELLNDAELELCRIFKGE